MLKIMIEPYIYVYWEGASKDVFFVLYLESFKKSLDKV